MSISGSSFAPATTGSSSYTYTYYADMWGWATWRRAWKHYDIEMSDWLTDADFLHSVFPGEKKIVEYWKKHFDLAVSGNIIDAWDYQWIWRVIRNRGLVVTPHINMISNLGFGHESTHTVDFNSSLSNLPSRQFPILEDPSVKMRRNRKYERKMEEARFGIFDRSIFERIYLRSARLFQMRQAARKVGGKA